MQVSASYLKGPHTISHQEGCLLEWRNPKYLLVRESRVLQKINERVFCMHQEMLNVRVPERVSKELTEVLHEKGFLEHLSYTGHLTTKKDTNALELGRKNIDFKKKLKFWCLIGLWVFWFLKISSIVLENKQKVVDLPKRSLRGEENSDSRFEKGRGDRLNFFCPIWFIKLTIICVSSCCKNDNTDHLNALSFTSLLVSLTLTTLPGIWSNPSKRHFRY